MYVSFAPACLASFECTLTCQLVYLLIQLLFFLDGCEEFETCNYSSFQNGIIFLYSYRTPVSVLFSYIHTDLLYWYRFSVCVLISWVLLSCIVISFIFTTWHAITCHLTPACCHLTLLVITWHMFYITHQLPPDMLLLDRDYHIYGNHAPVILYYIQWSKFIVLMFSCNSWTCLAPVILVNMIIT